MLRREEEAYQEARREAARVARLQQEAAAHAGPKQWTAGTDGDWEV